MTFDKLDLRITDSSTVEIFINDQRLLDAVKEIEEPFAEKEGHPNLAGDYIGLSPEQIFLPKKVLLGQDSLGFTNKVELYACGSCGEPMCWPLLVKITMDDVAVVWSEFEQPHRRGKWDYSGLGPFTFEKAQYLQVISGNK